jgi:hypothetical protein
VRITRIYSTADGCSHFQDLLVPTSGDDESEFSESLSASSVMFGQLSGQRDSDFHCAPRRQLCIVRSGSVEVECGDGTKRTFGPGDVLLCEDVAGTGHLTRDLSSSRQMMYIGLPSEVDVSAWSRS